MPIEVLEDIIEELANELDFYGSHNEMCEQGPRLCRGCWTSRTRQRIEDAVEIERKLSNAERK